MLKEKTWDKGIYDVNHRHRNIAKFGSRSRTDSFPQSETRKWIFGLLCAAPAGLGGVSQNLCTCIFNSTIDRKIFPNPRLYSHAVRRQCDKCPGHGESIFRFHISTHPYIFWYNNILSYFFSGTTIGISSVKNVVFSRLQLWTLTDPPILRTVS